MVDRYPEMDDLPDFRIVDCDAHYMESYETIAEYMDEPWQSRIQEGGDGAKKQFMSLSTGDRFGWGKLDREPLNRYQATSYADEPTSRQEILEGMDFLGIEKQIQISGLMLEIGLVDADDDRIIALTKAYVRYMLEEMADPDAGIYVLAPLPDYDVDAALEVLDMVEDEPAVPGICIISGGASPPLGNRTYDPIYERVQEMGLPLVLHAGGSGLDTYFRSGFQKMIETHTLGFLESNMAQLTSLLVQGVPEKFPDLDIVFMESGVTWIPSLLTRLDEEYLKRKDEAPLLTKPPSEYASEFYYGTQPLEVHADPSYLETVIEMIGGPEQLLYASDWPHWDFDRPTIVDGLPFLSDADKRRIFAENAEEVFAF